MRTIRRRRFARLSSWRDRACWPSSSSGRCAGQLRSGPRAAGSARRYTDPANLTDECIETYLRPLVSSPERIAQFHAYTVALDDNVLVPIEPQLRQLRAPARLVWSEQAAGFPVEGAQWLDHTLPRSRGAARRPRRQAVLPRGDARHHRRRGRPAVDRLTVRSSFAGFWRTVTVSTVIQRVRAARSPRRSAIRRGRAPAGTGGCTPRPCGSARRRP